jgi:hypothetical protein
MSQTPVPVSTAVLYHDLIVVQNLDGTYNNTLVNADFTKAFSSTTTGGISTAGIVITKVSADTTGKYDVLLPASLFPANGFYGLVIYITADPTFSWAQEYVASPEGGGSTGTLSFTASSGDGRVVDESAVAIEGATVYVTQGTYLNAFTTDASGDWGPFYANPSAGTFNIEVVKSGYAQASSSLVVGASSITGPGADIEMDGILGSNAIVASELWNYARRMAFNKTGTQADTKIIQLVNDSIDRLARENTWNWYERRAYLQLNAAVTGSVTLTNGSDVATIVSGTWPSWAGSGRIFVNNLIVDVVARTSSTELTLSAPWGGSTDNFNYTLFQNAYELPTNFLQFGQILEGQNWPYKPMVLSAAVLWQMENAVCVGTQYANVFGIAFQKLWIWPYPTVAQSIAYTFKARPTPLADATDLADVDPTWIEVLHKLIDYHVALYFGECVAGDAKGCLARYLEALSSLPTNDKSPTINASVTGGYPRNIPLWRSKSL